MDLAVHDTGRKPRVLVVEDTDITRQRIADTLRTHGYQVDQSADGLDALQKLSGARFDAILLDLILPHVNGWEFRQTQLRHPELARIPTIVVTVRDLRDADRYVLRAADIVQKPFEDAALLRALDYACRTVEPADAPVGARNDRTQLFWSRRGEVTCWEHAPTNDAQRWHGECWVAIPDNAARHGILYQCQHCPGHTGPIGRRKRTAGS